MPDEPTPNPPAPPPTAPPPTPPPNPPPTLALPMDEYQRLLEDRRKLGEVQAAQQAAVEKKEQERLLALAAKGEADKALQQQKDQYEEKLRLEREEKAQIRGQYHGEKKSTVIGKAFAGVKFVSPDAAQQAMQLQESRFETVADAAGKIAVVDRESRRPAEDVIKEWLASPAAAHFLEPSSRGGSGAGGADRSASDPRKTPEERAADQFRRVIDQQSAGAPGLGGLLLRRT